ncbi:HAMP domain-containing protein [Chitinibacter fontanus]|uniref:histidine kinase n=1 Tax=Chitinibacter fontanus TaxID=1737446 RepID=A0A7D5V7X2_9NEIS|nr:ATP-binding protein [Chitinibacter fontanus]QLI80436.1 HAMP domain-containing protein [Chitinibacter fontanus]
MGRLFWKFFSFIFLAQLITFVAVGSTIWLHARPPAEPAANWAHPPSSDAPRPPPRPHHFPIEPMLGGALASVLSAALLAWYVSTPVRHLRAAVQAAAKGDLSLRVSPRLARRHDELSDLARDYDHMADQLRALLEGQRRLLHDVSHELRSPLARLQLAIGLAQQQPQQQERLLERIERESERINQLIGELLTLSRIEAGAAQHSESFDLIALLSELVDDANFEALAQQKTIYWFPPLATLQWVGNPELLRRAFENILRNALRFSPANTRVTLEMQRFGSSWHFAIADQGPGVQQQELAAIFEPFYRAAQADTPAGYGLGLAIARRVIEAHGGQIRADNGADAGLLITIELPASAS